MKLEKIQKDLQSIFEGSYLPILVEKELIAYIIENRIEELRSTDVYINSHGSEYVIRVDDNGREVSKNEREAQLHNSLSEIRNKKVY